MKKHRSENENSFFIVLEFYTDKKKNDYNAKKYKKDKI